MWLSPILVYLVKVIPETRPCAINLLSMFLLGTTKRLYFKYYQKIENGVMWICLKIDVICTN